MDKKTLLMKIEEVFLQLSCEEQVKLLKSLSQKMQPKQDDVVEKPNVKEFQLKESEWVWLEMQESVKIIQQYRGLYVTAIFLTLGWLIGQIISSSIAANPAPNTIPQAFSLESIRGRGDVAALSTGVALVNLVFMMLGIEAYTHWRSLARYRFILGYELGQGKPAWRFDRWKETAEGSTRMWTTPLNIFFFLFFTLTTAVALWFPFPAVWSGDSYFVKAIWGATTGVCFGLVIGVVLLGIHNRNRNSVADNPTISWGDLEFSSKTKK